MNSISVFPCSVVLIWAFSQNTVIRQHTGFTSRFGSLLALVTGYKLAPHKTQTNASTEQRGADVN